MTWRDSSGQGEATQVEPSILIKVAFSEPIRPDKVLIHLTANGAEVPFTLLAQGREATADGAAQELWIVPNQRLGLGAQVKVDHSQTQKPAC